MSRRRSTPSLRASKSTVPLARSSPIQLRDLESVPRDRPARTIVPPSYPPASGFGSARPAIRSVPKRVIVGTDTLGLEHLSAFVLLHVDGVANVGQIAYSSGISVVEVVAMLEELCRRGIVCFEEVAEAPPPSISEVRVISAADVHAKRRTK